jgi:hypothetical protein
MSGLVAEIDGSSIVILGAMNPAIFHPFWFAANKLIRETEASEADILIASKEVSDFRLDWLHVQVVSDRFLAEVNDAANHGPLRDLVTGTFTLLEHTPLTAMGLNRQMHYLMESEEKGTHSGTF